MSQLATAELARPTDLLKAPAKSTDRSVKILAKSLFRELRTNGYDDRQIVALSTELIGLLTVDIRDDETR